MAQHLATFDDRRSADPVFVKLTTSVAQSIYDARSKAIVDRRQAADLQRRLRAVDLALAIGGLAGLCCAAVASVPDVVPMGLGGPTLIAAALLILAPLWWLPCRRRRAFAQRGLATAEAASQGTALATMLGHLSPLIAALADDSGTRAQIVDAIGSLLASAEAEVASLARRPGPQNASVKAVRRHKRIVPRNTRVTVRTGNGRTLIGKIKDVSRSGVALAESLPRVHIGDEAFVGRHPAIVTRVWDGGVAFRFKTELDAKTLDRDIVL